MADYIITLSYEQLSWLRAIMKRINEASLRDGTIQIHYGNAPESFEILKQLDVVEPMKKDMVDVMKEYYDHKVDKLEKKVEVMDKALDDLINWQNTLADLFETHQKGKKKEKKA